MFACGLHVCRARAVFEVEGALAVQIRTFRWSRSCFSSSRTTMWPGKGPCVLLQKIFGSETGIMCRSTKQRSMLANPFSLFCVVLLLCKPFIHGADDNMIVPISLKSLSESFTPTSNETGTWACYKVMSSLSLDLLELICLMCTI